MFDEVKVKEDLIYNKYSYKILGFVRLGEVNDHLSKFEKSKDSETPKPQLATHIVTFMVSGIFSDLQFPYASFPCSSITGDQLYSLVWGCVRRLEACGFKVVALTCDGASVNRAFMKLHKLPEDVIVLVKTANLIADENRSIYFISLTHHISLKQSETAWANSYAHMD